MNELLYKKKKDFAVVMGRVSRVSLWIAEKAVCRSVFLTTWQLHLYFEYFGDFAHWDVS